MKVSTASCWPPVNALMDQYPNAGVHRPNATSLLTMEQQHLLLLLLILLFFDIGRLPHCTARQSRLRIRSLRRHATTSSAAVHLRCRVREIFHSAFLSAPGNRSSAD